jgi:hypothetical protein
MSPYAAKPPWAERLTGVQSIRRAMALREAGLTYVALANVMWLYHDDLRSAATWRTHLRAHGAEAKHYASGRRRVPPQCRPVNGSSQR